MTELEIKMEGNSILIKAPLGAGIPSKTGKTLLVATTSGFVPVAGTDLKISLNIIRPRK